LIAPHCNNPEKEKENCVQCTGLINFLKNLIHPKPIWLSAMMQKSIVAGLFTILESFPENISQK